LPLVELTSEVVEILEELERASQPAQVAELARSVRALPGPGRYIALWAWSACLEPGPQLDAALAELRSWIAGDTAAVRDAACVLTWRAHPGLQPLVEPLASRLGESEAPLEQLWAGYALHGLTQAMVPAAAAFPQLFSLLEASRGNDRFAIVSYVLGQARRNGESFEPAVDWVARTLPFATGSREIYEALLDGGFEPPASHKPQLAALLEFQSTRSWLTKALRSLRARGDDLQDLTAKVSRQMTAKTAKELTTAVSAAQTLVSSGVAFASFATAWERALAHKVLAAREAAHRALAATVAVMSSGELERERRSATSAGFTKLAEYLAREPEPPRPARAAAHTPAEARPLDVGAIVEALDGDNLEKLRWAAYQVRRASVQELEQLLPALVDALATEARAEALDQLARGLPLGLELGHLLPVVAGLCLDRDYYDFTTLPALLRFLIAAHQQGLDIAEAWPWVPAYKDGKGWANLRFDLAVRGIGAGLRGEAWRAWLSSFIVELSPEGPATATCESVKNLGLAAACLVSWVRAEVPR
jgi:hypothetical protein